MMHSIKIISRKKNGRRKTLYLRIIKNRKTRLISLGIHIQEEEWNEHSCKVLETHPNHIYLNCFIQQKLLDAERTAIMLLIRSANTTVDAIKLAVSGRTGSDFTHYFSSYRDKLLSEGKIGSYIKVKSSFSKLSQFTDGKRLNFEDVTVTFLKKYSSFLFTQLKNSKNTIHSSIKVIRKLFNEAVTEGIIDSGQNPFLRYKLTTEPTSITYLTEEEIARIEDLRLAPRSRISQHRDIFIFACFACGLRISDLLTLEWHNFNGTHLNLTMKKTGRQITIPLPQKAIQIIKSFGKSKTRSHGKIFPFLKDTAATPMEMNSAISSATAYLNKNLRKIARMASIDKRISIGISRHTWATRALRKGMRIEYVSRLLGHTNIRTTQLYTAIVDTELDKAMEIFNI